MSLTMMRILAVHQIVGGAVGLAYGALYLNALGFVAVAPFVVVSLVSLVAGVLVWKRHRNALRWSAVLQAVQVPAFAFPYLTYKLGLGVVLIAQAQASPTDAGGLRLGFPIDMRVLGVAFEYAIGGTPEQMMVGVNVIALGFLIVSIVLAHRVPKPMPLVAVRGPA